MHKIPVILCLLWLGCSLSAQSLKTVEVAEAYKDRDRINLSTFAESIEYIQLETSEETLLSYPTVRGIQGDSIILVKSMNRISLFDKNSGSYLRDIGHKGEDPNSFLTPSPLGFNSENGNVFAYGMQQILQYSLKTGKVVSKTPIPDLTELGGKTMKLNENGGGLKSQISMNHWSSLGYFVGNVTNHFGDERLKVVLYDLNGRVIKYFQNHQKYLKRSGNNFRAYNTSNYDYKNQNYTKEWFSDTVFSFNTKSITPSYYFNTSKYSPPYAKQDELTDEQRSNLMFIDEVMEDDSNLYFQLVFKNKWRVGLFNKKTNQTLISDPESDELNGFYNDLDNFVPFIPKFRTQEGYLVGTISAEDVYTWFQENRSKANKLPEHLKKFRNIDPEDNPIVMIVKPKNL